MFFYLFYFLFLFDRWKSTDSLPVLAVLNLAAFRKSGSSHFRLQNTSKTYLTYSLKLGFRLGLGLWMVGINLENGTSSLPKFNPKFGSLITYKVHIVSFVIGSCWWSECWTRSEGSCHASKWTCHVQAHILTVSNTGYSKLTSSVPSFSFS